MSDPGLGFIPHPAAVVTNILSETLCSLPCPIRFPVGMDGLPPGELRRDLARRLGDEHGNRVEIGAVCP